LIGGDLILSVENLTIGYEKPLVSNLRFYLNEGESMGIIGPNGAGKSTLVRTILGLITPLSGAVTFLGQNIANLDRKTRLKLSYVPQRVSIDLSFPVTLRDVIYMSLLPRIKAGELQKTDVEDKVSQVLKRFGFNDPMMPLRMLSGGQVQRLLIARALVNDPLLTIMDEPTSNLDPGFTDQFYEIIQREKEKGRAFILVSHDLEGVLSVVDRCLIINFEGWELREHV
jgi:ABC-type Mn2+/Zn2+ transport system ATPase subunit